jgi:hypothetical protein
MLPRQRQIERLWASILVRDKSDGFYLHIAMIENEQLLSQIGLAFPTEPLPAHFFWDDAKDLLDQDIPQELQNRICGRLWTEVTLMDWRMTGTSPVIARRYLEPATFMYYVPSIITGSIRQIEFIEFALEGIIPDNKNHVPRGKWWSQFLGIASPHQRAALSAFLAQARSSSWHTIGLANQHLLECAESIWSS